VCIVVAISLRAAVLVALLQLLTRIPVVTAGGSVGPSIPSGCCAMDTGGGEEPQQFCPAHQVIWKLSCSVVLIG